MKENWTQQPSRPHSNCKRVRFFPIWKLFLHVCLTIQTRFTCLILIFLLKRKQVADYYYYFLSWDFICGLLCQSDLHGPTLCCSPFHMAKPQVWPRKALCTAQVRYHELMAPKEKEIPVETAIRYVYTHASAADREINFWFKFLYMQLRTTSVPSYQTDIKSKLLQVKRIQAEKYFPEVKINMKKLSTVLELRVI